MLTSSTSECHFSAMRLATGASSPERPETESSDFRNRRMSDIYGNGVIVGVAVSVGVGVSVEVFVGVLLGLGVHEGVIEGVNEAVGVKEGVRVGSGVHVIVLVAV